MKKQIYMNEPKLNDKSLRSAGTDACQSKNTNHSTLMRHVTPIDQLLCELDRLNPTDQENLCIALVCLLRFGMKKPLADLLDMKVEG